MGSKNLRQIAGSSTIDPDPNAASHACLWLFTAAYGLPSGANHIGTLGGEWSYAEDINNIGDVVGWSETSDGDTHGFIWLPTARYGLPAGMNDIGTLGGDFCRALAVSANGAVVGESSVSVAGEIHAFLWQNGQMTDLGTLDGGSGSAAYDINTTGTVVGASDDGFIVRACVWTAGVPSALPLPLERVSAANSINDSNTIVGRGYVLDGQDERPAALRWRAGVVKNLNELIGACGSCDLSEAVAVNDAEQIVANGTVPSATYGFLLTPLRPRTLFLACDSNCDASIDFSDIDPFLLAVQDPIAYVDQYPSCNWLCNNDANDDSSVDYFDVDPFLACLFP